MLPLFDRRRRLRLFFHASFLLLLAAVLISILVLTAQTIRASVQQQLADANLFIERIADERELDNYVLFRNQVLLAGRRRPVVPLYYPEPLYVPFYTEDDMRRGTARLPRWRPPGNICVATKPVSPPDPELVNQPALVLDVCAVVSEQRAVRQYLEIALKFYDPDFVPGTSAEDGDRLTLAISRADREKDGTVRDWTLSFQRFPTFPTDKDFAIHKVVAYAKSEAAAPCRASGRGASVATPADCAVEGQVIVPLSQQNEHWTVVLLRIDYSALDSTALTAAHEWPPRSASNLLIKVGRTDVDAKGNARTLEYAVEGDSRFSFEDIATRLGPEGEYSGSRRDTGKVLWRANTISTASERSRNERSPWYAYLLRWMNAAPFTGADYPSSFHRRLGSPMRPAIDADVSLDRGTWPVRVHGAVRFQDDPTVELAFTTTDRHPWPPLVDSAVRLLAGIFVLIAILYTVIARGVIRRLVTLSQHASLIADGVRRGAHDGVPPRMLESRDEIGVLARAMQELMEAERARATEEKTRLLLEHERRERELDRQSLFGDAERAQIEANKSRLEVIGHDIRSPLNSLNNFMERLPDVVEHRDHAQRMFRRMKRAILNLSETEDAISSVPLVKERQDLAAKLRELVEYSWMDNIMDVRYEGPDENVMVDLDAGALSEAVGFIVENADRERTSGTPIRVRLGTTRGRALFSVENQGSHIADENLERVFEYGFSTRRAEAEVENLGRGLYRARLIFGMHGGTVSARNTADGVAFDVALPLADDQKAGSAASHSGPAARASGTGVVTGPE